MYEYALINKGNAYTGTNLGFVFKWQLKSKGFKVVAQHRVHIKCIHTIKFHEGKIFTGGGDFFIKISSMKFKTLCTINTLSTPRAIDFYDGQLIYSTKNGGLFTQKFDIEKLELSKPDTLIKSHYSKQEVGFTMHEDLMYTCGDDNQLIVRNFKSKEFEEVHELLHQSSNPNKRSINLGSRFAKINKAANEILDTKEDETMFEFECDVSVNVSLGHLAISFNNGNIVIKDLENPTRLLFTLEDPTKTCECVEYSPDEEHLAVGSHDHKIYIYECQKGKYELIKTYDVHSGGIIGIDWSKIPGAANESQDKYIRTNWDQNELWFWNISEDENIDPETTKDIEWNSFNCKLTWQTQGVFPHNAPPDIVNCWAYDTNADIFATGDDNGRVNIYNNPCLVDFNKERTFRGHSGHVGRIAFTPDGEYMFSVGGYDHTVIQWKRVNL